MNYRNNLTASHKIVTDTYEYDCGFRIDIVDSGIDNMFEAWIYHKDYGIKELMFGVDRKTSYADFLEMADSAALDCIKGYIEDRMSED